MSQALEASRTDPRLIDLDETCAALDAVVKRAAEMVREKDCPGFRKKLLAKWKELEKAQKSGNGEAMAEKLNELGSMIRRGAGETHALEFFQDSVERTGKAVQANWKVRLDKAHAVNMADVTAIFAAFCDGVNRILGGRKESTEILDFCHRLLQERSEGLTREEPRTIEVEGV